MLFYSRFRAKFIVSGLQNVFKYEQSDSKLRENPQMFYDVCDSLDEVKEKIVQ